MPSAPFFKTIAIDTGQFARLVRSVNTETETPLPAIFVHYTNVRYLVMPPFTDHSDAPDRDAGGHGDHKKPTDHQVIAIHPSVGGSEPEEDGE